MATVTKPQTSSPAKSTAKKAVPRKKVPAKKPAIEWATSSSLPEKNYKDTVLPSLDQKVRVRFLTTLEATSMALLPDLARFSELMAKAYFQQEEPLNEEEYIQEQKDLFRERVKYMELVTHLCVIEPKGGTDEECDCGLTPHPKSLWSTDQVGLLDQNDMTEVCRVAERAEKLEAVRPFSPADTQNSTDSPVSTGE